MMKRCNNRHRGFSLTEVLMAIATLSIGMLFIGGTLTLAVHLSFVSNDQVMGSLVAEDALAKIRLYGVEKQKLNQNTMRVYTDPNEYLVSRFNSYPVTNARFQEAFTYKIPRGDNTDIVEKRFYEHILCKGPDDVNMIDVAVFVVRDPNRVLDKVEITATNNSREVTLTSAIDQLTHGTWFLDDAGNQIYRAYRTDTSDIMRLDRTWTGNDGTAFIWIVQRGPGPNPLITITTEQIPTSQLF